MVDIFNLEWYPKKDIVDWSFKGDVLTLTVRKEVWEHLWRLAVQSNPSKSASMCAIKELASRSQEKKIKVTNLYFRERAVQNAFIKAYFLYEFLVCECHANGEFSCEGIRSCIGDTISKETAVRIRERLRYEGVLWTDTSSYAKTVKTGRRHRYKYVFHPLWCQVKEERTSKIKFKITREIQSICERCAVLFSGKEEDKIIDCERGLEVLKTTSVTLARDTTPTADCNTLTNSDIRPHESIYIPPYNSLSLEQLTRADILRVGKVEKLGVWFNWHLSDAIITPSSRLWHAFHVLPKGYRRILQFHGSNIVEAMDIHNCFYVLMLLPMRLSGDIRAEDLQKYETLVLSGKFYESVERCVHIGGNGAPEIAEDFEYEFLSFRGLRKRDLVKKWLQSYRNFLSAGQAKYNHHNIDWFFRTEFPTIREWLFSYPTTRNRDGKKVKRLQSDMCRIETRIMSEVCFRLVRYGATPFTLHDAIYLSKDDLQKLTEAGVSPEVEFWNVFNNISNNDVLKIINSNNDNLL